MSDTILNQILQNQNKQSEQIGGITEIVKRHDTVTFPEIKDALARIESKHNQDYLQYVETREKIEKRLTPLEEDYISRKSSKDDTSKRFKDTRFGVLEWAIIVLITAVTSKVMALLGKL